MIVDTEAVVLRTLNHGDTSKIVTLYSRDTGRLKLIAKGVRSPRSKVMGLFQPTHHVSISYYEKTHSDLQLFKNGELVKGFYRLEGDFDRLTLAQVVVEFVERAAEREEAHPAVFDLLVETLGRLNDPAIPTHKATWFFHLQFLKEMGFRPDTDRCGLCEGALELGAWLEPRRDGLTCGRCQPPAPGSLELDPAMLKVMTDLQDHSWSEVSTPRLTASQRRRFWDVLWRYTHYHIEPTRNMRSLGVLNQLYG